MRFSLILALVALLTPQLAKVEAQEPATTPVPQTMSSEKWAEILQPTEACPLPCWLGIHPGETTLEEMVALITDKFENSAFNFYDLDNGGIGVNVGLGNFDPESDSNPPVSLMLNTSDDVVEAIYIRTPMGVGDNIQALEYFDILSILEIFGTPDTVRIQVLYYVDTNTIGGIGDLYLSWDDVDLAIDYSKFDSGYDPDPFCFQIDQITGVFIGFQHPDREISIDEFMYEDHQWDTQTHAFSRDSTLSNEEFVELFVENEGCFTPDMFDLLD